MPTADQDRSPSPLARSLHGKSFRHPGKRHAVACGVTPECKSEPKHEGSSEDEMRYVDHKPKIRQERHEKQGHVKAEIKPLVSSEPDQGGDPGPSPIGGPCYATCACSPLILSLRGSCEHRVIVNGIRVDEVAKPNVDRVLDSEHYEDTREEDSYLEPIERVEFQLPGSGLRGWIYGTRCSPSFSASGCRISTALIGHFSANSIHILGNGYYANHISSVHVLGTISRHGGFDFGPNDYLGSRLTLGPPAWGERHNSSKIISTPDGEALFGERFRRLAVEARAMGLRLSIFPKRFEDSQAPLFSQHNLSHPPYDRAVESNHPPLHRPFSAQDFGYSDGSIGIPLGIPSLVNWESGPAGWAAPPASSDQLDLVRTSNKAVIDGGAEVQFRRKNTGRRAPPKLCPECNKSFSRRHELEDHLTRHSGIKRHPCPNCNKLFRTRANMKRHCREVACV